MPKYPWARHWTPRSSLWQACALHGACVCVCVFKSAIQVQSIYIQEEQQHVWFNHDDCSNVSDVTLITVSVQTTTTLLTWSNYWFNAFLSRACVLLALRSHHSSLCFSVQGLRRPWKPFSGTTWRWWPRNLFLTYIFFPFLFVLAQRFSSQPPITATNARDSWEK